jgi:hypothetical protein
VIALYIDENVQGQIVRGLRRRGIDVLTAEADGWGDFANRVYYLPL